MLGLNCMIRAEVGHLTNDKYTNARTMEHTHTAIFGTQEKQFALYTHISTYITHTYACIVNIQTYWRYSAYTHSV